MKYLYRMFFVLTIVLFQMSSAYAQMQLLFAAKLNGSSEVPAVNTNATGTGYFMLNPLTSQLMYRITIDGLSGPLTASHFHNAAAGASGGVIQNITTSYNGNTATGVWMISPSQITELLSGRIYVNVHTAANPSGEIRGQLIPVPDFNAMMTGAQEVPPVTTIASGSGNFFLDRSTSSLQYIITTSGLSGAITASHIHKAPVGVSGGVIFNLTSSFSNGNASGVIPTLSGSQLADFSSGNMYVNVHTAQNPSGEIRGQIGPLMYFTAMIDGSQEVPPVNTSAKGTGIFAYNVMTSTLTYAITISELSGALTGAHFHQAAAGTSGSVVFSILNSFSGNTAAGVWTNITPAQITALMNGSIYVNFHTASNPSGEARGQVVTSIPTASSVSKDAYRPESISLLSNYPNPFTSNTVITFSLPKNEFVVVDVFDALGRKVEIVHSGMLKSGLQSFTFFGNNLPNGMYHYTVRTGSAVKSGTMILMR